MTTNAFLEDIHGCLKAGMNARVSKPIDMPALEQTVQRVLGPEAGKNHAGRMRLPDAPTQASVPVTAMTVNVLVENHNAAESN